MRNQPLNCSIFGAQILSKPMLGYCLLGTNLSEILIKYKTFHSRKCIWNHRPGKPFCPGRDEWNNLNSKPWGMANVKRLAYYGSVLCPYRSGPNLIFRTLTIIIQWLVQLLQYKLKYKLIANATFKMGFLVANRTHSSRSPTTNNNSRLMQETCHDTPKIVCTNVWS